MTIANGDGDGNENENEMRDARCEIPFFDCARDGMGGGCGGCVLRLRRGPTAAAGWVGLGWVGEPERDQYSIFDGGGDCGDGYQFSSTQIMTC